MSTDFNEFVNRNRSSLLPLAHLSMSPPGFVVAVFINYFPSRLITSSMRKTFNEKGARYLPCQRLWELAFLRKTAFLVCVSRT